MEVRFPIGYDDQLSSFIQNLLFTLADFINKGLVPLSHIFQMIVAIRTFDFFFPDK